MDAQAPPRAGRVGNAPKEIDWEKLDKTKFFGVGAGMFSAVTLCLFPLTVVKTRIQASPLDSHASKGALTVTASTFRTILQQEGVPGLYRGLGTVLVGTVPIRVVYLTTLEVVKLNATRVAHALNIPEAASAGAANLVAGGTASFSSQLMVVPIDVISQRQMISKEGASGLAIARAIVAQEGVRGLYRGFGASLMTYVPSSSVWWGAYGAYQKLVWGAVDGWRGRDEEAGGEDTATSTEVFGVQTVSAVMAGITSATVTTPLDTIKTRLQVADVDPVTGAKPTLQSTVSAVLREEGTAGLMRGVWPRMANVALWGTCMVSTYEFLKRVSSA